jgi:hypothetical protein
LLVMNLLYKYLLITICLFAAGKINAQNKPAANEEETVFRVFPNPNIEENETYVSLQGFKSQDLLVIVYDMLGREIYSKIEVRESEGFLFTISTDGNKLPAGVYMIIASADDKVFHQKLIVK